VRVRLIKHYRLTDESGIILSKGLLTTEKYKLATIQVKCTFEREMEIPEY